MKRFVKYAAVGMLLIGVPGYAEEDWTSALLDGKEAFARALPFSDFAAPQDNTPIDNNMLEGRLKLQGEALSGGFQLYYDPHGIASSETNKVRQLPAFDFEFVQAGAALIPTDRSIISTSHPYFDWMLSPGHIWQDSEGKTRLSIPFALMEKNANCLHNGVLMVRLDDDQQASNALVQIGSETCAYFKFNFWAAYSASWETQTITNAGQFREDYAKERNAMLPAKPFEQLGEDHPALDLEKISQTEAIPSVHMSAYGVVLDGVHYTGGCHTRMGRYPYCDRMALPSYSLAKSLAGGLGLMRLEALYLGAFEAGVQQYIPECSGKNWQGVTLHHLLDMTTGNYRSAVAHKDEAADHYMPFFDAKSSAAKTAFACNHFKRKSTPGKKWVYHTSDTYLLGVAMDGLLSEKYGTATDYYDTLLAPLWHKLSLSPAAFNMRQTEGENPQPFTGYGMVLYADDIVRLGSAITNSEKLHSQLATHQLDAALQRTPSDRGRKAGANSLRYNNGFWAWNAKETLGCDEDTWLPFMSGYGGISVVLLPGGNIYYYVSDSHVHSFSAPIKEIAKILPICGKAL